MTARRAVPACVAAMLLLGVAAFSLTVAPRHAARATGTTSSRATAYELEVRRLELTLDTAERFAAAQPESAIRAETAATHALSLARLSASDDAYARADRALDAAFRRALPGHEPHLSRALLDNALHRFDRAEADLAALREQRFVRSPARAEATSLGGDVALARGRYDDASAAYHAAVHTARTFSTVTRLAYYASKTGDLRTAETLYAEASKLLTARDRRGLAWLELQRALLDLEHGRHASARAHYLRADAALPGWWLVEKHLADLDALEGHTSAARARYDRIVATTEDPEALDALAALEDHATSVSLRARAETRLRAQLARFPQAAYAHAARHYLLARAPARALPLARSNVAIRPDADALVLLSQALLATGHLAEARTTIAAALATPWTTVELHATAAIIYEASGDTTRATEQTARAIAINPTALTSIIGLRGLLTR